MPFVTVDYFATAGDEVRAQLQQSLAGAVIEHFNAPPGTVRVFTRRIDPADVYTGDGRTELCLPIVRVEFLPGRTRQQKDALLHAIGHVTANVLQIPVDQVRSILFEKERDDWARGDLSVAAQSK